MWWHRHWVCGVDKSAIEKNGAGDGVSFGDNAADFLGEILGQEIQVAAGSRRRQIINVPIIQIADRVWCKHQSGSSVDHSSNPKFHCGLHYRVSAKNVHSECVGWIGADDRTIHQAVGIFCGGHY